MNSAPLVSAVITTHNRSNLVTKAIESVFNQTLQDIECIVIDDASTDNTKSVLEKLADEKGIKYIRIDHSRGGNFARNVGIKNASGKFIAFLDDDDEWLPDKIEKQVSLMTNEVSFVYCGLIREFDFDASTRKEQDIANNKKFPVGDLSREILIHILTNTSTFLVKRNLLLEIGMFDEHVRYWQEYDLSIRLMQKTKADKVPENLVLYRVLHKDNKRLSNNIKGWESSVRYISNKYANLIKQLSKEERNLRELYICMDGIARARSVHSTKLKIKYYALILVRPGVLFQAILKIKNKWKECHNEY